MTGRPTFETGDRGKFWKDLSVSGVFRKGRTSVGQ